MITFLFKLSISSPSTQERVLCSRRTYFVCPSPVAEQRWWQEFPWGKELPQLKEGQVCERKKHWGLLNHRDNIQLRKSWAKNSWRPGDYLGEISDMLALFLFLLKNQAADIVEEKALRNRSSGLISKCSFYGWQIWFGSQCPDKVYFIAGFQPQEQGRQQFLN